MTYIQPHVHYLSRNIFNNILLDYLNFNFRVIILLFITVACIATAYDYATNSFCLAAESNSVSPENPEQETQASTSEGENVVTRKDRHLVLLTTL